MLSILGFANTRVLFVARCFLVRFSLRHIWERTRARGRISAMCANRDSRKWEICGDIGGGTRRSHRRDNHRHNQRRCNPRSSLFGEARQGIESSYSHIQCHRHRQSRQQMYEKCECVLSRVEGWMYCAQTERVIVYRGFRRKVVLA